MRCHYEIRFTQIAVVVISAFLLLSPVMAKPLVECEGKYAMGDLDSKQDAKTFALMEAKRIALERAGAYLTSSSEVKN